MVVGKWTPSTVEGDMEEVSCLYDNGKEIVSVELDNGGTGKLCYHEYFNTGNIFNDAINSQKLYYYDCTWEIEGAYLKIKSEHNKTFAFSHTENGNWDLTSGEGGLIK